jgi:hypothetical protein
MKRLAGYAICVAGLCAFFTTCYYISFKHALNQFNETAVERDSKILESFEEYQKQAHLFYPDTSTNEQEATVDVDTTHEDVITPNTRYFLETYYVKNNELSREELNPTSDLVGLKRSEVIEMLADYMDNLPLTEKNQGLYAYDLLQFSTREIVIRKSYNEDLVTYRYYVAVKDGKVVIYYSDLKTIYEDTNIEVINLEEKDRNDLMHGIYIKTEEELFSLLESYSS